MIHGVVLGYHGEALFRNLQRHTHLDFAQEVWSFAGMGLQLQELYVSPTLMQPADWDAIAEASAWSRKNVATLRDSHWAFGDIRNFVPYAIASWQSSGSREGILLLRNPGLTHRDTETFTLAKVLELPESEAYLTFDAEVVKSLSDDSPRSGCPFAGARNPCRLGGEDPVTVSMLGGEVLVVALTPRQPGQFVQHSGSSLLSSRTLR